MLWQIKVITFITHIKPNNCFYVVLISSAWEYEQCYISQFLCPLTPAAILALARCQHINYFPAQISRSPVLGFTCLLYENDPVWVRSVYYTKH